MKQKTEPRWCLEFVGGPLDGRHDIETSVSCDQYIYEDWDRSALYVNARDIPDTVPYGTRHAYVRDRRIVRSCAKNGVVYQFTSVEVWRYEGTGR